MQFMIFTKVAEGIQQLINCRGLDRAVFIPVSIFNAVNYHRLFKEIEANIIGRCKYILLSWR